jgi:hypothetical protein
VELLLGARGLVLRVEGLGQRQAGLGLEPRILRSGGRLDERLGGRAAWSGAPVCSSTRACAAASRSGSSGVGSSDGASSPVTGSPASQCRGSGRAAAAATAWVTVIGSACSSRSISTSSS